MVYVASIIELVYSSHKAPIAGLEIEENNFSTECLVFGNVFLLNFTTELSKRFGKKNDLIDLKKSMQSLYWPIYSLKPVKLEILKTYIVVNHASNFIKTLKFPADALILFVYEKDNNLWLCVNYWGLDNLTIKNRYLLQLIRVSLD